MGGAVVLLDGVWGVDREEGAGWMVLKRMVGRRNMDAILMWV